MRFDRDRPMRRTAALISFLIAGAAPAAAGPECADFRRKHAEMVAEIAKRSPGLETDQRRERADAYLKGCIEDDDALRLGRPPCAIVDGQPVCRDD